MKTEKISELTTNRLSVYLRCLHELAAAGVETVSSQALAEQFNLNSAQIRKDLAYFGEFGVRGVGYYVETLRRQLTTILGLTREHRLAIIGVGNLGMALATCREFNRDGFQTVALFDNNKTKIGTEVCAGLKIEDVAGLQATLKREQIDIAVIATPATAAESVLEEITAAGVRAVLNFAPIHLNPPPGVKVKTVDLTTSLESLSYFLANPSAEAGNVDYREFLRPELATVG
jgi:redox-sensing transcriptional repressor